MKSVLLILVSACWLSACKRGGSERALLRVEPTASIAFRETPIRIESGTRMELLVGKRVTLAGVVSDAPIPQIQRVDLRGLEHFRGKQLLVSGVLQCTVVSSSATDTNRAQNSGTHDLIAPVYRGTGTTYCLQCLIYGHSR
jgi:hypothetical protein